MPAFQQQQYAPAAHLRDPQRVAAPSGMDERRVAAYRELLFNNMQGFIDRGFPVLKSLYPETAWRALIRCFFARHHAHSPYFIDIPQAFVSYLLQEHERQADDPPFLAELAHYEWMELALQTRKAEVNLEGIDRHGSLEAIPVLSPLAECPGLQLAGAYPGSATSAQHTTYSAGVHTDSPQCRGSG
ncbi:MAG: putative DNA-binding domain-containing protein [Thiolinea sp.]